MNKKDLKFWEFVLLAVFVFTFILLMMWAAHLILPTMVAHAVSNCSNVLDTSNELNNWDYSFVQYLGNGITAIPAMDFFMKAQVLWGSGASFYVIQCDTNNQYPFTQCNGRQTPYINYNLAYASTSEVLYHIVTNLTGLNPSKYFYFQVGDNTTTNNLKTLGSIVGERNFWGTNTGMAWEIPASNLTSVCYQQAPSSISISTPANLSTQTSVGYTATGTYTLGDEDYITPPLIDIKLTYHSTSTGPDLSTTLNDYNFYATTSTTTQNWASYAPLNLANATSGSGTWWQIDANIFDPVWLTLSHASSTSKFYVNVAGSQIPVPFIQTGGTYSTSTGSVLASCNDTNINFIQGILCYVFVPQYSSFSQFGDLYGQLINKPPIGYLGAISNIINGTSMATTSLDSLNIPTSGASPFTIFRTAMNWIVWLLFGVFIFNRFRHLQLW